MASKDIWLLFWRHAGRAGRWYRIVGTMFTTSEAVEAAIGKNVAPYFEYKAVRYTTAESAELELEGSGLDPRIPSSAKELLAEAADEQPTP